MENTVKQGYIKSIPVCAGYLVLGAAFGAYGYQYQIPLWACILMSVFVYAGSMQFAMIPLLIQPFSFLNTLILTLSINARHIFYGISMFKMFQKAGKKKQYMIFALTDESYSVIINEDNPKVMFWTQLFNQSYWIIGTIVGYLLITTIPIETKGIEFSMTALFVVIFIEKCYEKKFRPIIIGLGASILSLVLFGKQMFIIPSMILILIALFKEQSHA